MSCADDFRSKIEGRFESLRGAVILVRPRRLFVQVPDQTDFREVLNFCADEAAFTSLLAITGLDEGERFAVIYHLFSSGCGVLNLKRTLGKSDPMIETVSDRFSQADVYEREIVDLLGINVRGLVPGSRYPLPDSWPKDQYPLRKDWKAQTETVPGEGRDEKSQ